jgi:uncharacterized membrane protein
MATQLVSALISAGHVVGIAGVMAFSALRLVALRRRDVDAIRFADNGNGIAAIALYGAGLYRLFGELEKPLSFYTANHVFWTKMGLLALAFLLEIYPQYVVLPWHFRVSRKLPVEPKPGQIERMFSFAAWQLPCLIGAIFCAAMMARGIGLPAAAPPAETVAPSAGQRLYEQHCQACHQADGRGLNGRAAADFTSSPGVLDKSDAELMRSLMQGRSGTIGTMPAMSPMLSEAQLDETLSFVRQRFGASR